MESTCKRLLDYCVGGKATHGFTNSKSTSDVLQITLCAPRLQTLLPRTSVDISMLDLRESGHPAWRTVLATTKYLSV